MFGTLDILQPSIEVVVEPTGITELYNPNKRQNISEIKFEKPSLESYVIVPLNPTTEYSPLFCFPPSPRS